jgi:hypothetical protein
MPLTETLIVQLGTRLGKILLKSYLRDPAEGIADDLLEVAKGRIESLLDRREAARQFEKIGERIAAQLAPLLEREFQSDAVSVEAVVRELAQALNGRISADFFLGKDLDPAKLHAELKRGHPLPRGQFSLAEEELYDRALGESVRYLVEVAAKLPRFEIAQVQESLRRLSRLEDVVGETARDVKRISQWVTAQEADSPSRQYEIDYRLAVGRNLDYLELFGADLTQESRRQALSVAYVSLTLETGGEEMAATPVEALLATLQEEAGRLLIRGEAGSGKSTLFRWTAIQASRGAGLGYAVTFFQIDDVPLNGSPWRLRIPFLLRLRDCRGGKLPSPEDFPEMIAAEIGSPPTAWVRSILRAGRGLLLFDGLDEIPNLHRETVRREITAIINAYPNNFFLVSTRPEAVPPDWLGSLGFREARVNPLSDLDRSRFIDKWHEAVAVELGKLGKPAGDLPKLAADLKQQLPENPPVARLATNPLLCAMICALHRDRNQKLPETPSELCEYLCEVLLHRRERESGLDLSEFPKAYRDLNYRQKRIIVQAIAHFMVLNEESSIRTEQARKKVAEALGSLSGPSEADAEEVSEPLLERSGMFREAKPGHLDFIHNTFKEYLAGESFANSGDAGRLVKEALNPSWQRVVMFALATARQGFAADVLQRLLDRAKNAMTQAERRSCEFLALQGKAAALLLGDKELETELDELTRTLFPPKSLGDAEPLASTGDAAVSFLRYRENLKAKEAAACVRTLRLIGTPRARAALEGYLEDQRESVVSELSQAVNPLTIKAVQAKLIEGQELSEGIRSQIYDLSPLAGFSGMQRLVLSGAQIADVSPLAGLSSLKFLDLADTQVRDLSPLAGLSSLMVLCLADTQVRDLSPLTSLRSLVSLDLARTQVAEVSLLAGLDSLFAVYLTGTKVADISPLAGLSSLRTLNLSKTPVANASPLAGLSSLEFLDLSGTQVANVSPLAGLSSLEFLDLSGTQVANVSPLAGLNSLEALNLSSTQVTDVSPLVGLTRLRIYADRGR